MVALGRFRPLAKDAVTLVMHRTRYRAGVPRAVCVGPNGVDFERDSDTLAAPASTLKVVTALTVRRHVPDDRLDELVSVERVGHQGRGVAGLTSGDQVSYRDLLYGMLLPSDNDSADALGVAGGRLAGEDRDPLTRFLDCMHELADEQGWAGVRFADTAGNDNASRITARQLASAMRLAADDPVLLEVMGTRQRVLTVAGHRSRTLTVRHTLDPLGVVKMPEYAAGKTGGTAEAGSCMAWVWDDAYGKRHAAAIMGVRNAAARSIAMRQLMDDVARS